MSNKRGTSILSETESSESLSKNRNQYKNAECLQGRLIFLKGIEICLTERKLLRTYIVNAIIEITFSEETGRNRS